MSRVPVVFIGYQMRAHGLPVELVNEPEGSTVVYRPARHQIVNRCEYQKALRAMALLWVPISMIGGV